MEITTSKQTCGACKSLRLSGSGHFVCDHQRSSKLFRATGDSACDYFVQLEMPKAEPESKLDQETIDCCLVDCSTEELSKLKQDAARYRFIRDCADTYFEFQHMGKETGAIVHFHCRLTGDDFELDDAIDDAIDLLKLPPPII